MSNYLCFMLPKRLTIQGLYSYQEQQIIDFSLLTEAGIFGIFGSVGSGKSSILEAIGFALYGKTERLNDRENRNYNMMNLKSSELLIDFEFEHYDHSIYRFTVKGKRNSKRFQDVKTFDRNAYKLANGEWIPLESADASDILDLSYDNFRRTVIIPQGKFQEFLQLGNSERTRMMMDIFHLHKYDLSDKAKILEEENNISIARLEGELNQLGNSNEEDLLEKQEVVIELQSQEKVLKSNIDNKEKDFQELNVLKEKFELKTQYLQALQQLEQQKDSFDKRKKSLEKHQQAKLYFDPFFSRKNILNNSIQKRNDTIFFSNTQLEKTNIALEKNLQDWNTIKSDYAQIEEWQQQTQDWQTVHEIVQYKQQSKTLKEKIILGKKHIEKEKNNTQNLALQLSKLEETIRSKKAEQPSNIFVFNEIGEWFQQQNNIAKQIAEKQQQVVTLQERIEKGKQAFSQLSFSYNNWEKDSNYKKTELNTTLSELQNKKMAFSTKAELHQYALQLQDGNPCPLCGSAHHPNKLESNHEINETIKEVDATIIQTKNAFAVLENNIAKATRYDAEIHSCEEQADLLNSNITQAVQALQEHKKNFKWNDFNAESETDFIKKRQEAEQNIATITQLEIDATQQKQQLDFSKETLNKYENALTERQTQLHATLENIDFLVGKILLLSKENIDQYAQENILLNKKKLEDKIVFTKSQYEVLQRQIQDLDKQKSILESEIRSLNTEKQKESDELQTILEQILDLLQTHQFETEQDVWNILQQHIDTSSENQTIQQFENQLYAAQQQLVQLQAILQGKTFDQEIWQKLDGELKTSKETLSNYTAQIAQYQQSIAQLHQTLDNKKQLTQQLEKKQLRKDNIQTLKNLFSGSGFVNFISSVYLKNLCIAANDRFSKLTHNQLHLELGDNNEFLVRDLLNEGKTRSVKTLSGGQTFQASLSLALALADSIQYQNKSEQNFFFLDEGFGSLDKDALTTIYDTLKSLRKENRIVGIISHVEDLQQEIPVSLLVRNDAEKGSQIYIN